MSLLICCVVCNQAELPKVSPVRRRSYAQLGAGYGVSNAATATVARAHSETKTFMNAHGVGEVVLGPSTSQLLENLGRCYSSVLGPGDEVGTLPVLQSPAVICERRRGCEQRRPSDLCSAGFAGHGRISSAVLPRHRLAMFRASFALRPKGVLLTPRFADATQIIVQEACHEANAGPWYKAAERCGAKIRVWRVDPDSCETRLDDLRKLVGPATKLVALVHVSNILGEARCTAVLEMSCPRSGCCLPPCATGRGLVWSNGQMSCFQPLRTFVLQNVRNWQPMLHDLRDEASLELIWFAAVACLVAPALPHFLCPGGRMWRRALPSCTPYRHLAARGRWPA